VKRPVLFNPWRVCTVPPRAAKGHVGQGGTKSPYRFYRSAHIRDRDKGEKEMGRYVLLWLLGVPIPILLLVWMFGGLN